MLSRPALYSFLLLALIACGDAKPSPAVDSAAALASAKPTEEDAMILAAQQFSLLGAVVVRQDQAMARTLYGAEATLVLDDSTTSGADSIVARLMAVGKENALRAFERSSQGRHVSDATTITDSGSFVMIGNRPGADSIVSRGRYRSTLVREADKWVIRSDSLRPEPSRPR